MPETPASQNELIAQIENLKKHNLTLTQQVVGLERDILERFDELGTLTSLFLKAEKELKKLRNNNTSLNKRLKNFSRDIAKSNLADYRQAIIKSGLFDEVWYLNEYDDVSKSNLEPLDHFILTGASEQRNPSSKFDTRWYVNQYKDVHSSSGNPLVHYIRNGVKEGRKATPPAKQKKEESK